MAQLNHKAERQTPEWTPLRGLIRCTIWINIAVIVFVALMVPIALYVPILLQQLLLRCAAGFIITWFMFIIAHHSAGMTGFIPNTLAIAGSGIVMMSHHIVWFIAEMPTLAGEPVDRVHWVSPVMFGLLSLFWCIGGAGCALMSLNGAPGGDVLGSLMTFHLRGSTPK